MPTAIVNGIRLHYQTTGHGPDLVMVHGLAANLAFWFLNIVPRLARDFRVTVFDLRGHGESDMPPTGYTTRDMADDLEGLLDQLGSARVHLVGHSFGGAVALHFALRHPTRVKSLTLADARVHGLQPLPSETDASFWNERHRALRDRGIDIPDDAPRVLFTMFEELGADLPWAVGQDAKAGRLGAWNPNSRSGRKWIALRETTTLARDVRLVGDLDAAAIQGLVPPVLLMFGEQSRCLPTCRELERLLPGARTVRIPGTGHFFPAHVPGTFVQHLQEFLGAPAPSETDSAPSTGIR
jgi:pimeloyl-ACP methyl ester carboxylesterase